MTSFFRDLYRRENQYCKFDSEKLTLFTSLLYVAALSSCLLASRKNGRRFTMISVGVLLVFGAFSVELPIANLGRDLIRAVFWFVNRSVPVGWSDYKISLIIGGATMIYTGLALTVAYTRASRVLLFLHTGSYTIIAAGGLIWHKIGYDNRKHVVPMLPLAPMLPVICIAAGYVVACICISVAEFPWSWGPFGWLFPSEIFSLEVSSPSPRVNVSVNMFGTFVIVQIFLWLRCHMKFWLFFGFAVCGLVMIVFSFLLFPKTKGIPTEGMYEVWGKHWYWRKYVGGGSDLDLELLDVKKDDDNI